MADPVVLVIEDDAASSGQVERELEDRYGRHYGVVGLRSSTEARSYLEDLATSGVEVALVLAGQWRAGHANGQLLHDVGRLHPHAKRAVLIAWDEWGDATVGQAIFEGLADGSFEHWVLRPSLPPDEQFHQTITSMLQEWAEENRAAPYTVNIVADSWSGRAYELRETLKQCAVVHKFCLANSPEGRQLVAEAPEGAELPLVVFPNGRILANPTNLEISTSSGGPVSPAHMDVDVVIVGAGPAGLSAAVYGASEGFSTLVVDSGGIGGQATASALIRNYLGFPRGITGRQLAQNAYGQAWVFGANFALMQTVTRIAREDDRFVVTLSDSGAVRASAVLLAMGVTYRRIEVPALEALNGAGVFYGGSLSEAPGLAGREVFIVGGANSAGQAALHLAHYAQTVTLVVRGGSLGDGMSDYLVRQVEATENVETRLGCEVVGGGGDGRLDRLVLRDRASGAESTVAAQALFVLIGAAPNTGWLPTEIERDGDGFILTGRDVSTGSATLVGGRPFLLETSMPGIFAAGDVRHGSVKRVASAVGEGSIAIQLLHQLFAVEHRKARHPREDRTSAAV